MHKGRCFSVTASTLVSAAILLYAPGLAAEPGQSGDAPGRGQGPGNSDNNSNGRSGSSGNQGNTGSNGNAGGGDVSVGRGSASIDSNAVSGEVSTGRGSASVDGNAGSDEVSVDGSSASVDVGAKVDGRDLSAGVDASNGNAQVRATSAQNKAKSRKSGPPDGAIVVALPPELLPCLAGTSSCQSNPSERAVPNRRLPPEAAACKEAVIHAATPYNPVRIDAYPTGRTKRLDSGGQVTPLFVRIVYAQGGESQIREARIKCQLDDNRTVVALLE